MTALTPLQVAAAAYIGGFSGNNIVEAVQVAYAESSWDPQNHNDCCFGLWQINKNSHADLMRKYKWDNPADNARMANIIFQKAGSLLHPEGRWCASGHPPNGCNPWQGYGNANYHAVEGQAKMAYAQLRQQLSKGVSAEKILGSNMSNGEKTPEGGIGGTAVNAVTNPNAGFFSAINRAGAWITNPDNLTRIFKVLAGGVIIIVGGAAVLDKQIMNVIPAGKVMKLAKGASSK